MRPEALQISDSATQPWPEERRPQEDRCSSRSPAPALDRILLRASKRIAPLWPLQNAVAVNPFLGLSDERFEEACHTLAHHTGATMLMPRSYYRLMVETGRITESDIHEAIREMRGVTNAPRSVSELREALERNASYNDNRTRMLTEVVDSTLGLRTSRLAVGDISKWCAAYWDQGQAAWPMPWRDQPFYSAWRAAVALDRTTDALGFRGFSRWVGRLPTNPRHTIEWTIDALGLPESVLEGYFHRALHSIRGWVAYARYLAWREELSGQRNETIVELLAVRMAWDYALFALRGTGPVKRAWRRAIDEMETVARLAPRDSERVVDTCLQTAFDAASRRELIERLAAKRTSPVASPARKALQAAFCIDVRSEVFRRALETVAPEAETLGFAGFFGFPIEVVSIGQSQGTSQCPVLMKPRFLISETVAGANSEEKAEVLNLRLLRRRLTQAWKSFKGSAVSSFVYVETMGLAFAPKLIGDALGRTRAVVDPKVDGLGRSIVARVAPEIEAGTLGGRRTGLTRRERIDAAEAVLRSMSMTSDFARIVMLTGHGSTTVNNPHASGYDCGACGGNPGDSNARVAAAVLNDPVVREALTDRGIEVPDDTWFLGCRHDTTTDDITIFDRERVPRTHTQDLMRVETWLAHASHLVRVERAALLHIGKGDVESGINRRTRDWSQVRPEWGLARNAAFIAAPRRRTQGIDLEGRVFLHEYDETLDKDWNTLELILTAPMVVASWINLQYYGSAVDPETYGSGNKVLHNVVGTLGVLEGNGGDLRVGLPHQSVHDGNALVHEPLRLTVFIEAPTRRIDAILLKHAHVRELVDNGWLHLVAMRDQGTTYLRYAGLGDWVPCRRGRNNPRSREIEQQDFRVA